MRHILGNDLFASVIISGEPLWLFSDIPTSNRYQNWSIGWKPMRFFLRKYRVNIGFWKKIPPPRYPIFRYQPIRDIGLCRYSRLRFTFRFTRRKVSRNRRGKKKKNGNYRPRTDFHGAGRPPRVRQRLFAEHASDEKAAGNGRSCRAAVFRLAGRHARTVRIASRRRRWIIGLGGPGESETTLVDLL